MTEGRGVGIEQRIIAEFGEAESAKIIQLAAALMTVPAAPPPESVVPPGRSRVATVAVRRSDADQAGGEEIIQRTIEAVVCPADPSLPGKAAARPPGAGAGDAKRPPRTCEKAASAHPASGRETGQHPDGQARSEISRDDREPPNLRRALMRAARQAIRELH
jgi:hypothetical protein